MIHIEQRLNKIIEKTKSLLNNGKHIIFAMAVFPYLYWVVYFCDNNIDTPFVAFYGKGRFFRVLGFLLAIFLFLKNKKKPSKLMITVTCLETWELLIRYLHNSSFTLSDAQNALRIFAISFIIEQLSLYSDDLVKGLMIDCEIGIYANLVSILLFPKGYNTTNVFFLGNRNGIFLYGTISLVVSLLYCKLFKKYIRTSLLIVATLLSVVFVKCATSILSFSISGIIVYILYKKLIDDKYVPYIVMLCFFLANIYVILVYRTNMFSFEDYIFLKLFNKSSSLLHRKEIWNTAITMIRNNLLLGNGIDKIPTYSYKTNCHNQILQQLYFGGIIQLLLYILLNLLMMKRLNYYKNRDLKLIFTFGLLSICFASLTESYGEFYFVIYIVYFLLYSFDSLIPEKDNK